MCSLSWFYDLKLRVWVCDSYKANTRSNNRPYYATNRAFLATNGVDKLSHCNYIKKMEKQIIEQHQSLIRYSDNSVALPTGKLYNFSTEMAAILFFEYQKDKFYA